MNKRKRVAWAKHRKTAKKADEKRKAAKATGTASTSRGAAASST